MATTFTFISDGPHSALDQARAAAGEKDVQISGGANTIQQFLNAGLVDDIQIHLAPILLGNGIRLLDGVDSGLKPCPVRVVESPEVTHIRYQLTPPENRD